MQEHRQAYFWQHWQERGFHHANMIERLVLKVENGEMRPDAARVAIDGRKWIASRFHASNLLSEKLIGNITHHQDSIQEQHLVLWLSKRFWPNGNVEELKRKRKAMAEEQLGLAVSNLWTHPNTHQATRPLVDAILVGR